MKLDDLQTAFVDAVYAEIPGDLIQQINETTAFSVLERMQVYQNNTREALLKTLQQTYSIIETILGDAYFRQLAYEYSDNYPSQSSDLNTYGDKLGLFLAQQLKAKNELTEYQYLPDLAALEWQLNKIYYCNNRNAFDFTSFSKLSQKQQQKVVFHLSPDIYIHKSKFPIFAIWLRHQSNAESVSFDDTQEAYYLLIERPTFKPKPIEINKELYEFLSAINQPMTLAQLAEQVPEQMNLLETCIKNGWIDRFTISDNAHV